MIVSGLTKTMNTVTTGRPRRVTKVMKINTSRHVIERIKVDIRRPLSRI